MKLVCNSTTTLILCISAAAVVLIAHRADAACFPAIFNFGDDDGDTGGIHASFPGTTAAEAPPYGMTFFGVPQGRNSDGRLIIDFIAEAFGLRYLDPYLQSVTSDFSQGVNFATWGAVARSVSYLSPYPLDTQVKQFQLFRREVLQVMNETSAILARKGLLGNMSEAMKGFQQPYKKLYNDLFDNTNQSTTDATLHIALEAARRVPLPECFEQGLYFISIGTNDFKVGILADQTPAEILGYLPNVVTAVVTAVQDLYNAGARNIIVSGVGNIGCLPDLLEVINFTPWDLDSWGCLQDYNSIARSYNLLLQQALANLTAYLPAANLSYLDTYQLQHNLLFNFTANGMIDPIKSCCGVPSTYNYNPYVICGERAVIANTLIESSTCLYPSQYAVWDGMHYTEAANRYFVEQIFTGQFFDPPFSLIGANCALNPSQNR